MTIDPYEREQGRDTALWIAAALVVAALHVGLVAAYLLLKPTPEGMATAPVIDVAFVPAEDKVSEATPESLPAEPTPTVEQSDLPPPKDESVATHESVTEPEPPATTESVPPPEPVPPPVALQVPEPAPQPTQPDEVTVAPPPPPKPAEQAPEAAKPAPERAARKPATDEKKEREKKHKQAPPKPAVERASRRARLAMAPNPGADSEGARAGRASWENEVAARIRRSASYPSGARDSGTVRVGVTIDRNGRLVSRRLAGSSGSSVLDSAAMAIVARAAPYPRFPAGMTQAQISLTVPLHLRPQ